jgi:hypothetical protein
MASGQSWLEKLANRPETAPSRAKGKRLSGLTTSPRTNPPPNAPPRRPVESDLTLGLVS